MNQEIARKRMDEQLRCRPRLREMLWLPWWYMPSIEYLNKNVRRARKENPPGPFCLVHARLLAACYCDRKYIDVMLEHASFESKPVEEKIRIQAYLDIGLTLCDLGYSSEGISHIEKAISLEKRPDFRNGYILHLCLRLYNEARYEEVIELAKTLLHDDPRNPIAEMLLQKAYTDAGRFDEEHHADIRDLVRECPRDFGFLLPEFHFSLKDFKAASDAFDKYDINRRLCLWLPEYDYKKAVAYYYSDQQHKCRSQAARIRRRMKWDRFYRLDAIEKVGIERVPAIDEMIQSNEVDNVLFDTERISHYFKTLRHFMYLYIIEYRWYIISFLIVLVYFLAKLARYLL